MEKTVLGIFAHPDDAEIVCSGTLSLLKKAGWNVHIATLAPGDKGTAEHTREEITEIRKSEAATAVRKLDGTYHCLDMEDVYIMYDQESVNRVSSIIRKVKPSLVFTHNPVDYMVDHITTSRLVMTGCFSAGIKNLEIPEMPYEPVPFLYYCDPMEARNILGQPVYTSMFSDVSNEIKVKEEMLACHASQRNWLLKHHKMDEYILSMKEFGKMRGKEINVDYAEGFSQHLGHGFPQNNILVEVLGDYIYIKNNL